MQLEMSTSRGPLPKQLKGSSRAGVRAAKNFSRDVPLYPTANRKLPVPETTADEAADEMPPTPREMELFNARITKQKRTTTNHLKNSKSMGRRPRKSDTNQPLPPLSKIENSNNGLDSRLDSLIEMVREIQTSAPTEKMFNSGLESHARRTPSSPPRVNFLQKSHEGKLDVVPRLKIEKLISPRVQMYDYSPRATLSSERSQSSEHAYTFGHAIPSPRSAFSDIGSSRSDGLNTPR